MLTTAFVREIRTIGWGGLTEVHEKCNAVEDKYVCDVSETGTVSQIHLFLGSAHEEESRGIEKLCSSQRCTQSNGISKELTNGGRC